MNAVQSSPAIDGAFDAFLFAAVGDETNGMALTVLSALSRLDIDPWADAARLSSLSKDSAIVALAQSIARLPRGTWQATDVTAIATRLVELLPKPQSTTPKAVVRALVRPTAWRRRATMVLTVMCVALGIYLLIGGFTGIEHRSAGSAVEIGRTNTP